MTHRVKERRDTGIEMELSCELKGRRPFGGLNLPEMANKKGRLAKASMKRAASLHFPEAPKIMTLLDVHEWLQRRLFPHSSKIPKQEMKQRRQYLANVEMKKPQLLG